MRERYGYGKLAYMDFEEFLKTEVKLVEETEQKYLQLWFSWISKKVPGLKPHAKAFILSCNGGKKIRGALINLGYQIAGEKSSLAILDVAAAYEIFHSSILIHDDIIDQSLDRRGIPSLYQAMGGNHYGVSQAITLADAGFFLALKIISEANFPDKEKNKALTFFSKTMLDTSLGQMLDIDKKDPLTIMKLKTARYTISGPLILGAILTGAKEKVIKELGIFGENAGIAFQIRDDILDGEVESIDKAELEALKYKNIAKKSIPGITKDNKMSKLLTQMADYLVERQK